MEVILVKQALKNRQFFMKNFYRKDIIPGLPMQESQIFNINAACRNRCSGQPAAALLLLRKYPETAHVRQGKNTESDRVSVFFYKTI